MAEAEPAGGKDLPKRREERSAAWGWGEGVEEGVAEVLFEETAAFLDDDHVLAEVGEFAEEMGRRRGSSGPVGGWGIGR